MNLTRRTVLITGGSSGIGQALARQLLAQRNTVIITGRDAARLQEARRNLPGVHTLQSDVADPLAITALRTEILAAFPGLDILINNAGIMRNLDLARLPGDTAQDLRDLTREVDINLTGPIQMIQAFLPHLLTRPDAMIVNVSSGLAFVPHVRSPSYSAAKVGLHAYTRTLRAQLAGTSVRVVELAPPPVATPLLQGVTGDARPQPGTLTPEGLARKAIAAVERGALEVRPGLSNVLKIMSRVAPATMFHQLAQLSTPRH